MDDEDIEWRPICVEGFGRHYKVSKCGQVLSRRIKILKPWLSKCGRGYLNVSLSVKGNRSHQLVSRLVATAWVPNPDNKPHVNHINGISTDNRSENLEWVTHQENMEHAQKTGLLAIRVQRKARVGRPGKKPLQDCHNKAHTYRWRYGRCPSCKWVERTLLSKQKAKEMKNPTDKSK